MPGKLVISFGAKTRRAITATALAAVIAQAAGCGTLLYPERRGQTSGQIDPAVAILDGVGVIVFVIPGLIAFAIDFATGAIYLPPNKGVKHSGAEHDLHVVRADPATLTVERIDNIIALETGYAGVVEHRELRAERVASTNQVAATLKSAIEVTVP